MGHLDCGNFLSACDKSLADINCQFQEGWAMGFITGMNQANSSMDRKSKVGKGLSKFQLKYALIKYCRDNPLDSTADAIINIYLKLYDKTPE